MADIHRGRMPVFQGPVTGRPQQWTTKDIIEHVKTGMEIELSTLPLYFCALYSIKLDNGGWGTKARSNIMAVAEQEMLHLSLAGNMLRALAVQDTDMQPLYDSRFMPQYPATILFDKIDMKLQPANKENLECFLKIEAPYLPPLVPQTGPHEAMLMKELAPKYKSIGQFYKELGHGIEQVCSITPGIFNHNSDKQFRGEDFFDSKMTVVTDEKSALEALETIVDQGEGSIGVPDSHYAIYVELYQMRKEWQCVDYVEEPNTQKYKSNPVAYHLSLAVNASYCYLLQTIDTFWMKTMGEADRTQVLRNIHRIMVAILSPTAHVLVTQSIQDNKYAAPCFEFYPPPATGKKVDETRSMSPSDLFAALTGELKKAQDVASGDTKSEITKIIFSLEGLGPVS